MNYTRGLRATILTGPYHSPGGGFSARFTDVTLVGDGVPGLQPVRDDAPAVVLGQTTPGHFVARPAEAVPAGRVGWMASGAYIVESGCGKEWQELFGHRLPIPLHDRSEIPF